MTIQTEHSVIARAMSWWNNRKQAQSGLAELRALGQDEINDLARECGVSSDTLFAIVRAGPHGSDEMTVMMKALNIDPALVDERQHALFTDMAIVCATCSNKGECRRDLKNGTASDNYAHYCSNSETLSELRARPDMMLAD